MVTHYYLLMRHHQAGGSSVLERRGAGDMLGRRLEGD